MYYLNEEDMLDIGINWVEAVEVIEEAVVCLSKNEFAQPIKPYLRYRDLKNRIIAMPAFVGGEVNTSGIKWIASFPDNIHQGKPRAHSVVVLNNADTGEPIGLINTALLSIIRTAAVSGLMMKKYHEVRPLKDFTVGIIGWGPIGKHHLKMCEGLFGEEISKVFIYDIRGEIDVNTIEFGDRSKIVIAKSWQEVYENAKVFMTCTVSKEPYIDLPPKPGSLLLNVSLRDFKVDVFEHVKNSIIVDDWEEVCREKTDIETLHIHKGLQEEDTKSIVNIVCDNGMKNYGTEETIMFNPMGMAVFDIAIGAYYQEKGLRMGIGQKLA